VTRLINDFEVLTNAVVVSPIMQLCVKLGRFNLELNGVQEVDIYHDPEISADRLFMAETDSPYYIEPSAPPTAPVMIPFFSKRRSNVYSFGFNPRSEAEVLVFSAAGQDSESADVMARSVARELTGEAGSRPFDVIHMVMGAIGLLRDWQPLGVGFGGEWEMIELRMGAGFIAAIEDGTGASYAPVTDRECLISRFPVSEAKPSPPFTQVPKVSF
jgi:hypothetical protein